MIADQIGKAEEFDSAEKYLDEIEPDTKGDSLKNRIESLACEKTKYWSLLQRGILAMTGKARIKWADEVRAEMRRRGWQ